MQKSTRLVSFFRLVVSFSLFFWSGNRNFFLEHFVTIKGD